MTSWQDLKLKWEYNSRSIIMNEEKKSNVKLFISIAGALTCLVVSAVIITFKFMKAKAYDDRWKDYDECGI